MSVGGYEYGYECPECEAFAGLRGMRPFDNNPTVNGEAEARIGKIEDGDVIECPNCGEKRRLRFEKVTEE